MTDEGVGLPNAILTASGMDGRKSFKDVHAQKHKGPQGY